MAMTIVSIAARETAKAIREAAVLTIDGEGIEGEVDPDAISTALFTALSWDTFAAKLEEYS